MTRLYLMRHGIAIDREERACPAEAERFLTEEGVKKTRAAALGLRRLEIQPRALLTSPYLRAVQTAELTCEALGLPATKLQRTDGLLPEAEPATLFRELARLRTPEIICFGHAPNLDLVIAHALGTPRPVCALKKAGVACLDISSFAAGRGSLVWLLTPKALRQMAG
jgi:phosphohistidine phosphatase